MALKNLAVGICLVLILVAIGLGMSIIYSDYLYSPTGNLDALQVMSNTESGNASSSEDVTQLLMAINDWARNECATVLFKNGFSAGCGFCGFSNWAYQELGIDSYRDKEDGVYVVDDPAIQEAYVSDNIFLPDSVGLEIAGRYSNSVLPPVLRNVDFLYPLALSNTASGMYFTDAKDTDKLVELFNKNGHSVVTNRSRSNLTWGGLLKQLITDSFLSRAVLFAMIGLIFCYVYNTLMLYNNNIRRLWIHHLFGLSRKRIVLSVLLLMIGIITIAATLFAIILLNCLTYMDSNDLRSIFIGTLLIYIILTVVVNCIGYCRLSHHFRLRGA